LLRCHGSRLRRCRQPRDRCGLIRAKYRQTRETETLLTGSAPHMSQTRRTPWISSHSDGPSAGRPWPRHGSVQNPKSQRRAARPQQGPTSPRRRRGGIRSPAYLPRANVMNPSRYHILFQNQPVSQQKSDRVSHLFVELCSPR
jgi:hypothetical protein